MLNKKRGQNKKGLSNIVAMLFLVLVALLAIAVFWVVVKNLLQEKTDKIAHGSFNCIKDVDIDILDACYKNNLLKITIKNKRELILGDFFLVTFTYTDGTKETAPTPPHTYLQGYETKTIIVPYIQDTQEIRVIPKIENQVYLCYESAPEYKNIREC